ncbi:MAG: EAL domain-containing protein [Geminicoccaceae bacterium]|nr:EAL domain-containing protein [Geminicoccaceae bacterium]
MSQQSLTRKNGPDGGASDRAARVLSAVVEGLSQGILVLDRCLRVVRCNASFRALVGLSASESLVGRYAPRLLAERAKGGCPLARGVRAHLREGSGTATLSIDDGRMIAFAVRRIAGANWIVVLDDITAASRSEAFAHRLARHDPLTDLPNRRHFLESLSRAVGQGPVALLCLDLDRFKPVNDTLGHPIGDALLRVVAERLCGAVRKGDTVARLGGDEFAVLLEGLDVAGATDGLARRLVDLIGRTYIVDGHMINIGVSVGIALAPNDAADPDTLLKHADLALYRAKGQGRGTFRFFEPGMDAALQARRRMETELRQALGQRAFELHYQAQQDLASGRINGFEALLRWRHPERGLVPPVEFIPLAEETGLIVQIGEWVLRTACKEAMRWPDDVSIAVNLSVAQFKSPRLVAVVAAALKTTGLAPRRLELEITESLLMQNDADHVGVLRALHDLGVRIAMDDFGTGYSSLSTLHSFPFDKIKIDRSFVDGLKRDPRSAAVVHAVAALGGCLGIATTAEGVETDEQLQDLIAKGCTEVQGYLIGRPLPAEEAIRLLDPIRSPTAARTQEH